MHSYRRVAAVAIAAGLLATAGCWNPAPEKYPSITFFGANYGTITAGGSVTLTWQTRLAEKVNIVAIDPSTGNQTTVKTFASGDTSGCTVNPTFPDSDCVKDGTLQVSPTTDTIYNIEAIVGAGDCSRDPVLGNLLHPAQCNDLNADPNASLTVLPVSVVPASTVSLTVGGGASTTVTSGTDVTADYTVSAAAFDFGILGQDTSGNPTYDACGADGDTTVPCWYESVDANGNVADTGTIKVPGVTATMVLTGESTNGADDGAGDVAPGTPGSTVTINVGAASAPTITAVTVDGNDALGATPATATADTASLAWTNNADATGGSLMTAMASDATTAGDCTTVPSGSWTAASGFDFTTGTYGLTGVTADMCYQLTATGSGSATDVKTFMVMRQVNIDTVTANGSDALGTTPVSAGATNPPVIAWTTSNAGSYSLAMVDKGTATDCATADYTGATPVTGTTGDGTYTPTAAISAATCFQLMVTHPTDSTRTATVTFEIDP